MLFSRTNDKPAHIFIVSRYLHILKCLEIRSRSENVQQTNNLSISNIIFYQQETRSVTGTYIDIEALRATKRIAETV